MERGLYTAMQIPWDRESMARVTTPTEEVNTEEKWFRATISSFHAYSYALGMHVPGRISCIWLPRRSHHPWLRASLGYLIPPSQSAATAIGSAACASSSFFRFQRFMYAWEVSEPAECCVRSRSPE